ncbi:protein phosphatase 1 regulatory subunit 12C-like [Lampetra fluviatilis]
MESVFRRSYLTPVRDEESESQRKARSRQARQNRRSTQGVTLTELHQAERVVDGRDGRRQPAGDGGVDEAQRQQERGSAELFTGVVSATLLPQTERQQHGEGLNQVPGISNDTQILHADRTSSFQSRREPPPHLREPSDHSDFKKLFEEQLEESRRLKEKLVQVHAELSLSQSQLERVSQRPNRSTLLEAEKRETRALERKRSEMEEDLKCLPDLKADNQRLKDENGALIRVISKLSK